MCYIVAALGTNIGTCMFDKYHGVYAGKVTQVTLLKSGNLVEVPVHVHLNKSGMDYKWITTQLYTQKYHR